jgi:hypothetical protein
VISLRNARHTRRPLTAEEGARVTEVRQLVADDEAEILQQPSVALRLGYAIAKGRRGWYSLLCVCFQHGPRCKLEKVMGKGNNSQKNDKKSKKPKQNKTTAKKK